MTKIELGNNYTIEEDSNGDLKIVDGDGSAVLTHDNSADTLTIDDKFGGNIDFGDNDANNIGALEAEDIDGRIDVADNVVKNTDQSISDSALTQVEFDVAEENDSGGVDLTNDKIVIQEDGRYTLSGSVRLSNPTASDFRLLSQIQVNRDNVISTSIPSGGLGNATSAPLTPITVSLSAGDDITLFVFQDSGGSEDIQGSNNTVLNVEKA